MICHDTEENGRSEYTQRTLLCLITTVDWTKHELVVVDNGSCEDTKYNIRSFLWNINNKTVITLPENVGTARALNMAIALRKPKQNVVKIDNDIYVHSNVWVDEMEEAINREPRIGVLGLKRKDLAQSPYTDNLTFKSDIIFLPHESGQTWISVEKCADIMGSCTMFSSVLLDTIGYSYQMNSVYGFEDCLTSLRSTLAGMWNCFLYHINIDHLDRGDNGYAEEKRNIANENWDEYQKVHTEYCNGTRPLYYDIAND